MESRNKSNGVKLRKIEVIKNRNRGSERNCQL